MQERQDRQDRIENPQDKESIIFLSDPEETGGRFMRYEVRYQAGGRSAHSHCHPTQTQILEVIQGKMGFTMDGISRVYLPGEEVTVRPGIHHYQWNAGEGEVAILQQQWPAGEMESFLRNSFGLVRDGRMSTLQVAATLGQYEDVVLHSGWRRWALWALGFVARALGHKGSYPEYERSVSIP